MNSGQVCIAANHVYVDPSVHDQFVERLGFWLNEFFKDGHKDRMSHIVSDRNYERIAGLLKGTQGKLAYGGEQEKTSKYIQPTIITDVTLEGKSGLDLSNITGILLCPQHLDKNRTLPKSMVRLSSNARPTDSDEQ